MVPWPFCEVRWGTWLERSTLTAQHSEAIGKAVSDWLFPGTQSVLWQSTDRWPCWALVMIGAILLLVKGFFKSLSFWLEDNALVSNSSAPFGKPSYSSPLQLWMFVFGWKTFSNDNIFKNLMGLSMIICQKGDATEHTWMQQKSSWSIACSIISWSRLAWAAPWRQTEPPPMCLRPWLSRLLWIGLSARRSLSFCFFFPFG